MFVFKSQVHLLVMNQIKGSSPKVVLDYFRTRLLCTYKEKISKSDFSYTAAQENPPLVKYMLW